MSAANIFPGAGIFTRYAVELQVVNRLTGGVPKDPDVIKGWLKTRLEMEDAALIELAQETYEQVRTDDREPSTDELADAITGEYASGNGFKRINGELVYEGRCMKAAFKEAANIAYPGTDFPGKAAIGKAFRKGLMNTLTERVFVVEEFIPLGVDVPTVTEQRVKHVRTPQGPRSAIGVVDFVEKPLLRFHVDVLDDFVKDEVWGRLWQALEQNGIGADRARGDGVCELIRWERVS